MPTALRSAYLGRQCVPLRRPGRRACPRATRRSLSSVLDRWRGPCRDSSGSPCRTSRTARSAACRRRRAAVSWARGHERPRGIAERSMISVTTRPSWTIVVGQAEQRRASSAGRRCGRSRRRRSRRGAGRPARRSRPRCWRSPSWMSPWFQAKLWRVRARDERARRRRRAGDAPPVAKKNQSGSANSVNVGVRIGSAVTMCRIFISTGSASATMMLFWTALVYGFSQLRPAISRSRLRTAGSVVRRAGCR